MAPLRFLHTADWQMGMRAAHVGKAGAQVRAARLEAARRVAEVARKHAVHFILVAGDTFENNAVDRVLVQQTADLLASARVPVYLLPGNHDPLVPGSVWESPAWSGHPNLHVLRQPEPISLECHDTPPVLLFPAPLHAKYSPNDPTRWIHPGDSGEDVIRIGVAHGTVQGAPVDAEPDYPIARDAAQRAGLDYLALGHWHSFASYPGSDGVVRMAYSGTHETTKFGERDSGNVLLVEISAPGARPALTPIRTAGLSWQVLARDLRSRGDLERLVAELEAAPAPDSTLLDVRLSGLLEPDEAAALERLRILAEARFLYARTDLSQLHAAPDDEVKWVHALPPGIGRGVALHLAALANPGSMTDHESGGEGLPSSAVAARALRELYLLVQEAGEA